MFRLLLRGSTIAPRYPPRIALIFYAPRRVVARQVWPMQVIIFPSEDGETSTKISNTCRFTLPSF